VGRCAGACASMLWMRLRKLTLYLVGTGGTRPRRILTTSAGRLWPSKARLSVVSSNRMQPSAQTSLFALYG
jgi:hypothetical protein